MKGKASAARTVDEYMTRLPPRSRAAMQNLRTAIQAAAPDAVEVISYGMPAFKQKRIVVYYAAFEDHCSLFVASASLPRGLVAELKPYLRGKGTLRFTPERPLPARLVTRIVKARLAANAVRRRT